MYVAIQHHIKNPQQFWQAAEQLDIPSGVKLLETIPSADGKMANCLWEADSVDTVKSCVERATGGLSQNEYYEVDTQKARGLPH